jgi:uncharacterized protein involved in exopolysaccharide biosynthesis
MNEDVDQVEGTPDLRGILLGIARSSVWVALLTLLGVLAGLGYSLTQPNEYISEGKIQVRLGMRERSTPDSSLGTEEGAGPTPGIFDEIELLNNPLLYERIALDVGPAVLLTPYDPAAADGPNTDKVRRWLHRLQSWWLARGTPDLRDPPEDLALTASGIAQGAIAIMDIPGTSFLLVQSRFHSPEVAQRLTQSYLKIAGEWHREVYSTHSHLTFVSDQLARYEQESQAAQDRYTQHREECGFYELPAQKEGLLSSIAEHESKLHEDTIRLYEVTEELAFVEKALETTATTTERLVPPAAKVNPEYQSALAQLQKLSDERLTLASTYTEGSEIYRRKAAQLEEEIQQVEKRLERSPEFIEIGAASVEKVPNPRHEELSHRRLDLLQERETRTKTAELRKRSKEEQEEQLRRALQCEAVHRELNADVERSESRVHELAGALEQARSLDLIDRQEDMESLRIVQNATLSIAKTGPNRKRFLAMGFAAGLAAGLGLALLRHFLDSKIRYPQTLEKELGVRILGVVPELRRWRKAASRSRAQDRPVRGAHQARPAPVEPGTLG